MLAQDIIHRDPVHELHHNERAGLRLRFVEDIDVVAGRSAGMLELGHDSCLVQEAFDEALVRTVMRETDEFDSDSTVQLLVVSRVDLAHPAWAQR